jgi:hypothetical protein
MKNAIKPVDLSRRGAIAAAGGAVLSSALPLPAPAAHGAEGPVMTRPIPSSGERLPIVGVTAVIPGTDKPEYMLDNLDAARGALPDAAMRRRIVQYWDSLA